MPESGISKCISLPTPFLFHLHKSVSVFKEPILVGGKGDRTSDELFRAKRRDSFCQR